MNTLIEGAYWPTSLETKTRYARRQDDTDGKTSADQYLAVAFSPDGDAWVDLPGTAGSLRFRTWAGGGQSSRVRNALLVLAEAIKRDNAEQRQCQFSFDDILNQSNP